MLRPRRFRPCSARPAPAPRAFSSRFFARSTRPSRPAEIRRPAATTCTSFDGQILAQHEVDQQPVKALQANRPKLQHARHHIRGEKWIGKRQRRQHAERRTSGQVQRCRDNRGAGAFRTHQRARQVEAVLRQQLIEVVARNAPRNARKLFPNQRRIAIAQSAPAGYKSRPRARRCESARQSLPHWCAPRSCRVPS